MTSLGLLQIANFVIPLLVIPIITRVLGTDAFGKVSYAQNIVTYLTLLVNYGFEFSATRQVAIAHDHEERQRIFWSVMRSKVALLLLSFIVLAALLVMSDKLSEDVSLYVYTAMINIGVVLFPSWYLQGVQDMQKMACINFVIKVLGAVLVVSLIHRPDQYWLYPFILSLSSILIGIGAFVYVIKCYQLELPKLRMSDIKEVMRPGRMIFLNQVFVSLYTTVNFTLLGLYLSDADLGIFSGAQRIILAANACLIIPVSTAFFPEISKQYKENPVQAQLTFKHVLLGATGVSLLASIALFLLAPWVVRIFLGAEFMEACGLLRRMSPIPCLVMAATILTVQGLYGRGLQRYAPIVGGILAALCIGLNLILIPRIGMNGAIWSWTSAEACEIILVGGILLHHRKCSI